jgi:hypothetical protein
VFAAGSAKGAPIVRVDNAPRSAASDTSQIAGVAELIYELLDAHADTAELATRLADDNAWRAHLDYLRSLQRVGREALARIPAGRGA